MFNFVRKYTTSKRSGMSLIICFRILMTVVQLRLAYSGTGAWVINRRNIRHRHLISISRLFFRKLQCYGTVLVIGPLMISLTLKRYGKG